MKRGRDESSSRFNHQMPSYDDERIDAGYDGSMPMYGTAKDWDRDALPVVEQQSFSSGTSRTGKRDSRQQHYKGRDHSAGSADRDYNHGSTDRGYNHGNADHDYYHDSADHGYNHDSADRGYNHDIDADRVYYHGNADRDYHSAASDRDCYSSGIDRDYYNSGIDRDYEVDRNYGSNNNSTNTDRVYHSSSGGQQRRRRSRSRSRDRSRDEIVKGGGSNRGRPAVGHGHGGFDGCDDDTTVTAAATSKNMNYHHHRAKGHINSTDMGPTKTVMIKGLPIHTTEPTLYAAMATYSPQEIRLITQRDGECKGYAFAEFASAEYAQLFIRAYAGSAGDRDAPQLIIENRAVTVEFARDRDREGRDFDRNRDHRDPGSSRHDQTSRRPVKSDWLCDTCSCHNFAKRDSCFKCNAPRTEKCPAVNAGDRGFDPAGFPDSLVATDVPGTFLVVRGFSPLIAEEQLNEVFRQYAQVKTVVLIRDPATNFSRGLAYIEFHSIDHAMYALQNTNNMLLGGGDVSIAGSSAALKVAFARESTMRQLIQKSMQPGNVLAVNPMVTAALQAAQWSVNNSYAAAHLSTQPNSASSSSSSSSAATAATHPQFVKVKPKWPLPFETNGGAYLFQAKSGCFFEPVSEFYYDVKAKLYYNSIDGTYYHYDATTTLTTSGEGSCHPFKLFIPPPPNDSYPDHTASTTADTDTTADSSLKDAVKTTNISSATAAVGMSKVSIGFGLIGAKLKSKKIVTDIAKWGQIQQDNRSEEEEDEAAAAKKTGKDKKSSSVAAAATDKAIGGGVSSSSSSSSSTGVKESESKRDRSGSDLAHISSTLASKQPRDHAAMSRTTTAADDAAVNNHYSSSSSRTVEQKSVVPAGSKAVGANAPVCLVCKRQFASQDMLQRHERESKLHAENLLKLSQP